MAQQLADLGEPVSDRTLTLNLLRGLNERFRDAGRHIRRGHPFPKFKDAIDELILEELTMAHQAPTPPTALLDARKGAPSGVLPLPPSSSSGTRPPPRPLATGAGTPAGAPRTASGEQSSSSGSGPSGGGKPASTPSTGGAGGATWPSFLHPWAGAIQMWPGPRPSTPLPVAPTPPQQQHALLVQQAQAQALLAQQAQAHALLAA